MCRRVASSEWQTREEEKEDREEEEEEYERR